MEKSKTKSYNSYDPKILEALFLKYGLSKYYIRQSVNGSVHGVIPDSIKKDYAAMEKVSREFVTILIQKTMS
ncbi:hypothetical protein BC749_102312 [Flavobacterium araucananum]|uniref:Uncharacterized protein n=1 Tax=Flavobacterium araucananum TaxID=946678 RepID=A0A227P0G5_9FLAO|nr:hypothetical protein [Flavobacterium araucananum]OXG02748.1 hypothetical protein B0A64_18225 [Flavobacterium araucananum]PWK00747.1 hypothetical protein BC749_102312 [Flavobacterium araucananum]